MFSAENLHDKLREINALISEKTNPDGSLSFDPQRVIIALELARRMIDQEENTD